MAGVKMSPTDLGEIARRRRLELGLKQQQVVDEANRLSPGSLSEPTYRSIENGRTTATDRTLAAASRGLGWPALTLAAIRDGSVLPTGSSGEAGDHDEGDEVVIALRASTAAGRISEDSRDTILDAYTGAVRRHAQLLAGDVDSDHHDLREAP